jgi:hypothetical protein
MTTAELERIARGLIPTDRWTGWRITETGKADDGATVYAVVPIVDSLLDGKPVFRGSQRDCRRMYGLLTGTGDGRRSRALPGQPAANPRGVAPDTATTATEAPGPSDAGARPPGQTWRAIGGAPRLPEAPDDQAGPRTRGPEPATAIDPAHQAVTGAP